MKKFAFLIFTLIMTTSVHALEIDEKLTLRVLKLSKTKKTMLINRGLEDGLVVGDHAKFFLTAGVMARGVIVKASPTRSVWSIYRIIDPTQVLEDQVMNLKISTPMKLTEDSSKSFRANVYGADEEAIAIPMAPGADDLGSQLTEQERKDLENLGGNAPAPVYTQYNVGIDVNKTIELWTTLHLTNTATSTDEGTGNTTSGSNTVIDISAGIEKYFGSRDSALGYFSLFALLHSENKEVTDVNGVKTAVSALEGGVGANYHFFAHPLSYGRIIGYAGASLGIGVTNDSISADAGNTTITSVPDPVAGSATFLAVGTGLKYFLANGFGGRVLIDYYSRSETYRFDTGTDITRSIAGPRVQFGFSYRF